MQYVGHIYRPPSEAFSLIIQVTVGCSHNNCSFCPMYKDKKFHLRPFDTVLTNMKAARARHRFVKRIFFADGDALCLSTDKMLKLLEAARSIFPECERISVYTRASHVLRKSPQELKTLREAGLGMVYIGAESGSPEVLSRVNKGETASQLIESVHKAEAAGIETSVTFISGLGGKELMEEHAIKTGEMITAMNASYVGLLTLMLAPNTTLYEDVLGGRFEQISMSEVIRELELILEHANCKTDCALRSNHASNRLVLKGTLPHDKDRLMQQIRQAKTDDSLLRTQYQRGL